MSDANAFDWDSALADAAGEGDFTPIPEGTYMVRVTDSEYKVAGTGSPMVKLTMEVVDEGPYKGRLLWSNLVSKPGSDGSRKMFAVNVMAFGISEEWLAANKPSFTQIATALNGRLASAVVIQKEYQGEMKNEVKRLKRIPDLEQGPPRLVAAAAGVPTGVPGGGGVPTPGVPTPSVPAAPSVPSTPPLPPTPPSSAPVVGGAVLDNSAVAPTPPEVPAAPESVDEEPF